MTATPDPAARGLRSSAQRTLAAWSPPTAAQADLRRDYLDHLSRHADGWRRDCPRAHLTASALIWADAPDRVLLTLHAKIGRWLQTGGHIEATDGSLEQAALRESVEESGLPGLRLEAGPLLLSRHQVSCGGSPTDHLDVQFLVLAPAAAAPVRGAESLDLAWFLAHQLPEVDSSVRDLVRAAVARRSADRRADERLG